MQIQALKDIITDLDNDPAFKVIPPEQKMATARAILIASHLSAIEDTLEEIRRAVGNLS